MKEISDLNLIFFAATHSSEPLPIEGSDMRITGRHHSIEKAFASFL